MNGKDLKKIILSEGLTIAEVARRLGTSQQDLTCALGKEDIRTGLLEKIAAAMEKALAFFYGETYGTLQQTVTVNNNTQVAGNSYSIDSTGPVLELLKIKDEQLLLAMRQTSAAQEHASKAQEQMDRVLDKLIGA